MSPKTWLEKLEVRANAVPRYSAPSSRRLREGCLLLDTNENLCFPRDFFQTLMQEAIQEVDPRLYDSQYFGELQRAIATKFGVSRDSVCISNGSGHLLEILLSAILEKGDLALGITPSFSMYRILAAKTGAVFSELSLGDDFGIDSEAFAEALDDNPQTILLCSPNNPTGNSFNRELILDIIKNTDALVILDEAYADFEGKPLVDLTTRFDNVIVTRTFSKYYGLAGLKIGYCVSSVSAGEILRAKYMQPYPVSSLSAIMALKMLQRESTVSRVNQVLCRIRDRLFEGINAIDGLKAFPSETNFLLVRTNCQSTILTENLLKENISVRNIGSIDKVGQCVRITVPPSCCLQRVLDALGRAIE